MRAIRWRVLFEPDRRPPLWPVTKATLLGLFFNNILPARAGEAARVVALKHYSNTSRMESMATIVVERVFDVLSLLLLLFVSVPWLPHVSWLHGAVVLTIALGTIVVIAIAAIVRYGERPIRFLLRPLMKLPGFGRLDVDTLALSVTRGLSTLRRPGHGLVAFVWTISSWLVMAFSFWLLMRGFDLHLPFLAGLLTTVAVGLAFLVPAAPAAVGVFEAAAVAATTAYGVPRAQALAYAVVLHALNFFPFMLAGLAVLVALPGRGARRRIADAPTAQ
jgi:uncharacterized membrane protein YbhN (UPF0104 family)